MRSFYSSLLLTALLLAACTATPEPLPTPVPTGTPIPLAPVPTPTFPPLPQREPLLRIAVLGQVTTTNVWALFDEAGANYLNYATQADYWPRLYKPAPPSPDPSTRSSRGPVPATAQGEPPALICDTLTCTAIVSLQPDLTWTDGSPFTAEDVAFTANTAMQFQLSLNWRQAYNPEVLDHAEMLDKDTVKFYFKRAPSVEDWQYGVLQGPILNQAYWQPRIADAVSLLPEETLPATIRSLEDEAVRIQARIDNLNISLRSQTPTSAAYGDTSRQVKHLQEELIGIYNRLEKNRATYEAKLSEARASLFALPNVDEPTLGVWRFVGSSEGAFENRVVLGTIFGDPWFDNIHYNSYYDEAAAVQALLADEADVVLTPRGLTPESVARLQGDPEITLSRNLTRSARFLVFNHANPYLADPALHQALACMLDPQAISTELSAAVAPLNGFVLDDFWRSQGASLPCAGIVSDMRLAEAVRLLKAAGYSWSQEPAAGTGGKELATPDGTLLPRFSLLAPTYDVDARRAKTAEHIARQADLLGLAVDVRLMDLDGLVYEIYGAGDYDMALLGWHLSVYPAYLCDWFTPFEKNPFAYSGSRPGPSGEDQGLKPACEAWGQTSDLELAKARVSEIQSTLMQDLPFIPLYAEVRYDAYRNVSYPFGAVVDGLAGLYGAPALAIPNP